MKFSIFMEVQVDAPTREREAARFRECVDQVVAADDLGYHCVWVVEHHGLYEYSHSSAPEVFLAYCAARTKRIRLGHGVVLTPSRYNHPIRVAERIATLDILSGGRVNFGSGKSNSPTEQGAFQVDRDTLHREWIEAIDIIPRMWRSDVFEYKGDFYDIPPIQVIPKPVQRPHPPMYAASSRPETTVLAGELGLGCLNFAHGNDSFLEAKVKAYKEAAAKAAPKGRSVTSAFACTPNTLVLDDDRRACELGFRGSRFFGEALREYYFTGRRPTGRLPISREPLTSGELEAARTARDAPGSQLVAVIGDPVAATEAVSRFRAAGVDELILMMELGTVPHSATMESLRTFAEKVMPRFA